MGKLLDSYFHPFNVSMLCIGKVIKYIQHQQLSGGPRAMGIFARKSTLGFAYSTKITRPCNCCKLSTVIFKYWKHIASWYTTNTYYSIHLCQGFISFIVWCVSYKAKTLRSIRDAIVYNFCCRNETTLASSQELS